MLASTMQSFDPHKPNFNVIRALENDIDVREYAAYLVAEVVAPGPASEAGYIFGKHK